MNESNGQIRFGFPSAPIGAVASAVERSEVPEPGRTYRQIGVRLWGEGAYERESLDGSQTKYNKLNRVEAGDIIVNKIWARNGSVSVVADDLAGCFCSGEFPLFRPCEQSLDPRWFFWMTKTRWFWHRCDVQSRGTSGKNRIRPERFLAIEIPLPPLAEQRRIVAKIDRLAAKIDEAHRLRMQASAEIEPLLASTSRAEILAAKNIAKVPLETVCSDIIDCLHSNPTYSDSGIPTLRSPDVGWGKLFIECALKTSQEEFVRRTRRGEPEPGDVILVREGGGTGKAGIVQEGQRVSLGQRVMQLKPNRMVVLPTFLLFQWLSPLIYQSQIVERMKGSASPHLNIGALRKSDFLLPPLEEQRSVVARLERLHHSIDNLSRVQSQTAAELDALLPSILDRAFRGML